MGTIFAQSSTGDEGESRAIVERTGQVIRL